MPFGDLGLEGVRRYGGGASGRGPKNERPLPWWRKGAGGVNGADRDRTDNLLDATEALSPIELRPRMIRS